MFKPEGVYVAMLTPFDAHGALNEVELRKMVDFYADSGVQGIFPISSVGEYVHLRREEKIRMMEIVVDQNRGRVRVTPGIGSSHPRESIFLAKRAEELGCDAAVLAPPYFYPLPPDDLETFFTTIIQAVKLPVILYNIPLFTQPLSYDTLGQLISLEGVAGIKESSGSMVDFMHFLDTVRRRGKDVHILTGREETFLASLMMGGKGCMTATAGILPEVINGIYSAWNQKDFDGAMQLQRSILPLLRAMFTPPFPLGFKRALEARGFRLGPPRHLSSNGEEHRHRKIEARIADLVKTLAASAS